MAARRPSSVSSANRQQDEFTRSDVFDDEFAEDYASSIHTTTSRRSDPFRDPSSPLPTIQVSDRQVPLAEALVGESSPRPCNSIRKAPVDGSNTDVDNGDHTVATNLSNANTLGIPNRTLSVMSSSSVISPDSPTHSGPSHPYNMYPQNFALSRSASTATAPDRTASMSQHRGPTHPYAMYPQTTSSNDSRESANQGQAIPLGFPGRSQDFHRRIGPEGEEQDIVGSEGHTEQLPPYTRYPDAHDSKNVNAPLLPPVAETSVDTSRTVLPAVPVLEISPTEEMPLRVEEATASLSEATTIQGTPEHILSEKPAEESPPKGFKALMKRRLWGDFKVWMLILLIIIIVIIATVCGGVIGSFLSKARSHGHLPPPFPFPMSSNISAAAATTIIVTTTRYVDSTPIPTPASLGVLPTGAYAITFSTPVLESDDCLMDESQQPAWSCDYPSGQTSFAIDVEWNNDHPTLSMFDPETTLDYGAQPPYFSNLTMYLMKDFENSTYGPGYQFSMYYDKLVILPASALTADYLEKRDAVYRRTALSTSTAQAQTTTRSWWLDRKHIQANDQPWFCWFNNTFIDGYIYVDSELGDGPSVNASSPLPSTLASSTVSSFVPTSTGLSISGASSTPVSPTDIVNAFTTSVTPGSNPGWTSISTPVSFSSTSPTTLSTITTLSSSSTSCAYPGPTYWPPGSASSYIPSYPHPVPQTASANQTPAKRSFVERSKATAAAYPRFVKLEERRLAGVNEPATCTQMSKAWGGGYTPLTYEQVPITIALDEQDPQGNWKRKKRRDDTAPSGCYCQWCN